MRVLVALFLALISGASAFAPMRPFHGRIARPTVMFGEIEGKLVDIVAEQLGVDAEKVTGDANFANDLGADSLDVVEMVMKIEEEFGVDIPDERAEEVQNLGDAVKLIEELKA